MRVLHAGTAEGGVQVLTQPLSFWGAFDPRTGLVIDVHHPQCGMCLTGAIVMMRESRGSGSASGSLAEAIRLDTAPNAIILANSDVNLAIGAAVAEALYGKSCAVLSVGVAEFERLLCADRLRVFADGTILPQ